MTLEEIADSLPNEFHDTHIKSISIDYLMRTAKFDLEIWVGDSAAINEEEREAYRNARLTLSGLLYCVIEPPDPRYDYSEKKTLWVGGGSHRLSNCADSRSLALPFFGCVASEV